MSIIILFIAIFVLIGLFTTLIIAANKHETNKKEDETEYAENDELCHKPHKWYVVKLRTPKEFSERLCCLNCGLISGTSLKVTEKKLLAINAFKNQKDLEKIYEEERIILVEEFSARYSIDKEVLERFIDRLIGLPEKAEKLHSSRVMNELLTSLENKPHEFLGKEGKDD